METVKKLLKSRTVWLAVLQAVGGVAVAIQATAPEIAGLAVLKSIIDILLRIDTVKPIL